VARVDVGDLKKAGAVRKRTPTPKPSRKRKDDGEIGVNSDGALNLVAPGDLRAAYPRSEAVKRRNAGETLAAIAKSYGVDLSMISRL
jgi:hypothetical protein